MTRCSLYRAFFRAGARAALRIEKRFFIQTGKEFQRATEDKFDFRITRRIRKPEPKLPRRTRIFSKNQTAPIIFTECAQGAWRPTGGNLPSLARSLSYTFWGRPVLSCWFFEQKRRRRCSAKRLRLAFTALAIILSSTGLLSQQTPALSGCAGACEFPVTLRQSVVAGKTPAGTKVEAKLVLATLVNGTVIPRDAILSGEITESVARASEPSRIAIRMDLARW